VFYVKWFRITFDGCMSSKWLYSLQCNVFLCRKYIDKQIQIVLIELKKLKNEIKRSKWERVHGDGSSCGICLYLVQYIFETIYIRKAHVNVIWYHYGAIIVSIYGNTGTRPVSIQQSMRALLHCRPDLATPRRRPPARPALGIRCWSLQLRRGAAWHDARTIVRYLTRDNIHSKHGWSADEGSVETEEIGVQLKDSIDGRDAGGLNTAATSGTTHTRTHVLD